MPKTRISIKILRPKEFYLPGSWIEGIVHLESQGGLHAEAVRLKFFGEEYTHWTEGSGDGELICNDLHNLWTTYLTLWGYPKSEEERSAPLPSGSFAFPFRAQIPSTDALPASGEYAHGHICYGLCAQVETAQPIASQYTIRIEPRTPLNVENVTPDVPVELEALNKVGCCIFNCACFGNVRVRARCLDPILEPGKRVCCTASIDNLSFTKVVRVKLAIVHRIEFRADRRKKKTTRVLSSSEQQIELVRGESFSNLAYTCTVPVSNGESAANENENEPVAVAVLERHRYSESNPFSCSVPTSLPVTFDGNLITSSLEVVFQVCLGTLCALSPRLTFHVAAAPLSNAASAADSEGSFTPTLLEAISSGQFSACFSFQDMNYQESDQYESEKPVSYPHYYDKRPNVIPASLDSFDSTWRKLLDSSNSSKA